MGYERKSRLIPTPTRKWRRFSSLNGIVVDVPWETHAPFPAPRQTTFTWVNPPEGGEQTISKDDLRIFRNGFTESDPRYDRGHEFWTTKTSMWLSHPDGYVTSSPGGYASWCRGPLVPNISGLVPTFVDLDGRVISNIKDPYPVLRKKTGQEAKWGTQAIKAVAPAAPQANMASSIGELISAVPRVPGSILFGRESRRGNDTIPNSWAGEFLNYSFGVAPTIADGKKILKSLRDHSALLRQLARDDGRQIRRKYRFPSTVSSTSSRVSTTNAPLMGGMGSQWFQSSEARNQFEKVVRTETEVWFSGAFAYFLPSSEGTLGKLEEWERKANYLLGTRLTAEALWQLMPWSWLIDWAGTIGDVLANATRFSDDGLVIRYGYLMVKTTETDIWSTLPGLTTLYGEKLPVVQAHFQRVTKRRIRATPFGFATDWNGLSPFQWAILAAIGITGGSSVVW